jgi:uncharacterized protein (TIGR02646 family)
LIAVEPREPGTEWNKWKEDANTETIKIIRDAESGKPLSFKSRIWKKLKPFLVTVFKKKCAYCEGIYIGGAYMDVEHYRPKAKVAEDQQNHPGYYWLAYDWRNLLLSCSKCNSGKGKMNRFPINGQRACSPGDSLEAEDPLLLNPYQGFKTKDHFTFGTNGIIAGKTGKGTATVNICDLNREELQTSRQREWEKTKARLFMVLIGGGDKKIITGDMEYSAYLKDALRVFIRDLEQRI